MIGYDFIYNGNSLLNIGCIMAHSDNEDISGLTREPLKGSTSMYRKKANHWGATYSEVLTLNFFIVKDTCDDVYEFDYHDTRELYKWLTTPTVPTPLRVVTMDGTEIDYFGIFTSVTPYQFSGINGFAAVFTCDSPFGYITKKKSLVAAQRKQVINSNDDDEFVYPVVTLTGVASGTHSILNENDENSSMSITFKKSYSSVVIDTYLKRIIADGAPLNIDELVFNSKEIVSVNDVDTGIFSQYWFRLVPGKNAVTYTGDAQCEIEYMLPIKIGGYENG